MQRWKLLRKISKWPAGTELARNAAGEWFLPAGAKMQPIEHSLGKILDGLLAKPKNWIEKVEGL